MVNILLVDDHQLVRKGLKALLESHPGYQVIAEASNGRDALLMIDSLRPDLVLLDLVMPECDGRQALAKILELDPQAKVVILSSLGAQSDIEECLRLGARSYLQKPIDPDAMERVLRDALA